MQIDPDEIYINLNTDIPKSLQELKAYLTTNSMEDCFDHFDKIYSQLTSTHLQKRAIYNILIFADANRHTQEGLMNYFGYTSEILYHYLTGVTNKEEIFKNVAAYIELNYLSLLILLKSFYRLNNYSQFLYSNKTDTQTCVRDGSALVEINKYMESKLFYIITHINDIYCRIICKEYKKISDFCNEIFSNIVNKERLLITNLEWMLDIVFLSCKLLLRPDNQSLSILVKVDKFSENVKKLFSVVFDYLLINYNANEAVITYKFSKLFICENYLLFSYLMLDYTMEMKFSQENDFVYDFHTFYTSYLDFINSFYSKLKVRIIFLICDYISIIDNIESFDMEKLRNNFYIPPYLVQLNVEGLKQFIIYHWNSWYLSENTYEFVNRNYWISIFVDVLSYCDILTKLIKIVYDLIKKPILIKDVDMILTQSSKNEEVALIVMTMFFDRFNEKNLIILNKKCVLIRSIYNGNYLFTLRHMLYYSKIFRNINWNNFMILPGFERMIQNIEEISSYYFKNTFIIAKDVLRILKSDNNSHLRINFDRLKYCDLKNILRDNQKENMDHNMIEQPKSSKKNKKNIFFDYSSIEHILTEEVINSAKSVNISFTKTESSKLINLPNDYRCYVMTITPKSLDLARDDFIPKNLKEINIFPITREEIETLIIHIEDEEDNNNSNINSNNLFVHNMKYYDWKGEIDIDKDIINLINFLE